MLKPIRKILFYLLLGLAGIIVIILITGYHNDIRVEELESLYLTPESGYVQVMDSRVHIRKRGEGPAIILLHGSFSSLHTWQAWEEELSKTHTTLSLDLPGHGLTGPNQIESYSTDYYADLVFALADSLEIDSFVVAGNSMGGNVAWKMALKSPDRIKKLILIDAAGFWNPITNNDSKGKRPWIFTMLSNKVVSKIFTKITPRFLFKLNMKQVYGDPTKITETQIDRYYHLMLREGNREATLKRLQQPGRNLQDSISFISVPTLILWGKKDSWIPVEHAYHFHKAIKNSELVIFDRAGHVPMEEIPEETVETAKHFLQSN